jgi:hypothetical protein
VFDTSGSVGCDVTIVDPTCPAYSGKSESVLFREAEQAKTWKHVLNGATMVTLVMSTFGKLGTAAEGYLQNLATVACSTGVAHRGVWLRISIQYSSCALVSGRGIFLDTTTVVLQKVLGRSFVMVQLCHSNDFGSL